MGYTFCMGKGEKLSWTNKEGWAQGDDAEREVERTMGPGAVERIREEVANRPHQRLIAAALENRAAELRFAQKPHHRRMEAGILAAFRQDLEDTGGELRYTFSVNPQGLITRESVWKDMQDAQKSKALMLVNCAYPVRDESEATVGWTVADLKTAIEKIKETFPDITFELPDDPTGATFTYIARAPKKD